MVTRRPFVNVRFGAQIAAAAVAHHLDPRLLAAVAAQETGGPGVNSGRNVVGDGGHGRGVFQIDDRYWGFARTPQAMDPAKNAEMAATILADNLHLYGGDVRAALSAYNAGSPKATGTLTTWGDGARLGYAASVMRHYDALGAGPPSQSLGSIARPGALPGVTRIVEQLIAAEQFRSAIAGLQATAAGASALSLAPNFAPAPMTPIVPWTQLNQAGSAEANAADRALADIIDSGDAQDGPSADI